MQEAVEMISESQLFLSVGEVEQQFVRALFGLDSVHVRSRARSSVIAVTPLSLNFSTVTKRSVS